MKILITIQIAIATLLLSCSPEQPKDGKIKRVVSMAPSITEIVCTLGEQKKLVAVTSYCDFPENVKELPKVGGLFDSSIEVIFATNPDLVIHLPSQEKTALSLNNMGIATLCVSQKSIKDINQSITTIAGKLGCPQKAETILGNLTIPAIKLEKSPKVLIVISRDLSSNNVSDSYIVGKNSWYSELLEKCGATNAFPGKIPYPSFSLEGVMIMNPDIIIELIPEADTKNFTINRLKTIWKDQLPNVTAVKNGKIYIIKDTYAVRPGPRYPLLYNDFKKIVAE